MRRAVCGTLASALGARDRPAAGPERGPRLDRLRRRRNGSHKGSCSSAAAAAAVSSGRVVGGTLGGGEATVLGYVEADELRLLAHAQAQGRPLDQLEDDEGHAEGPATDHHDPVELRGGGGGGGGGVSGKHPKAPRALGRGRRGSAHGVNGRRGRAAWAGVLWQRLAG